MNNKKEKILVIDDSATNIVLVKGVLEEAGYEIITSNSAKKALKILDTEKPDLILLDLMMPQMSGYDFLEKMNEEKLLDEIPVIVVSAKITEEAIDKAIKNGASDYIKKPVDIQELTEKVDAILNF